MKRSIFRMLLICIATIAIQNSGWADASRASWMQGKYGVFVHYLRGMNGISGDNSGSWDATVYSFNATAFAETVAATGASFVVFALGQTDGYYSAGNDTYSAATGLTGYDSNRNLPMDIAFALQPYGIKLFLYLAAEGPRAADPTIVNALSCADARGPLNSNFRTIFNAMVEEWSVGLGSLVSGWWLDGTWTYWDATWNNGVWVYNDPGDGSKGLDNLNALITACRTGNPNAVVAVNTTMTINPDETGPRGYTTEADFTTGELNMFSRTPRTSSSYLVPVTDINGTAQANLQYNVTSYLGTSWGQPDVGRYTDLQIANYVYFVTKAKGTVMIDMAINADGTLSQPQLSQMAAVNTTVNVNRNYTDYSVYSGGQLITDLVGAKPSWLMSNDGVTELPTNYAQWFSSYGNCNWTHANVFALAGNEWAWNYEVDLGSGKFMNYYVVEFPTSPALFATAFVVEGSSNRSTWRTMKTVSGITSGGRYEGFLDYAFAFRYVRVRAIAPNGPNQTGSQMALRNFELYLF